MGAEKYQEAVKSLIDKTPVISYKSIERIIKNKKKVKQYVKQLVRNLVRQGKLKRLTKGYYTAREDVSLAVFCFQPAYLGIQDALSHHGLWEQETIPVVVTVRKVRSGIRKVLGGNVLIRRIDKRYFFGLEYSPQEGFALPYSDLEKTFIDLVYFKVKISKEVLKEISKNADKKKLESYLKAYPKKTQEKIKSFF